MLLRRVMENVQKQNWLAVFLDFIIVVFGVVVASSYSPGARAVRRSIELRSRCTISTKSPKKSSPNGSKTSRPTTGILKFRTES